MHYPNVIVDSDAPPVSEPTAPQVGHYKPENFSDRFALGATKLLRLLADLCFRQHYIHRAVVLETVAAVPGMVGATLQQLQALRLLRGRPDMVKLLIDESENERMHLMTFVSMCQPNLLERALILMSQGLFFNGFFLLYLLSPYTAHRLVGYFEEEAVVSYTRFLAAIDDGQIADRPIPAFARAYWKLDGNAGLRDLVIAVRQDEMHHRDVNHHLSLALQD
ncbi:MAG: alternative oxidase [Betaproteobacteria bacterium]|nr:alternative oxidase [Betaproteobacteria bacterium]